MATLPATVGMVALTPVVPNLAVRFGTSPAVVTAIVAAISIAGLSVYWIFPNMILTPIRFGCFLVRAYPTQGDPGRHVSRVDFYMKSALVQATGQKAAEVNEMIATIARVS